jgi:hypothetical protein
VVQVNTENYERLTREQALELVERLLAGELPPPTLAADGAVTEPSTAALHWRLSGLGEPPAELAERKPGEVTEVPTAFPAQPPAPSLTEDPTTRPVEELRTGVDHGGGRPGEDGGTATRHEGGEEPEDEEAGRRAAGQDPKAREADAPQPESPKAREADAPQPESPEPGQAAPDHAEEAGPHQREQPGGEAQ